MHQPSRDTVARIAINNAGREPERLAMKYERMRRSDFAFFRGTAHLFWEDAAAQRNSIPDAPAVWACGDLHLENFGSYRGANGLAYFDLNDFDEAAVAPATWELARLLASIYVAAPSLALDESGATELAMMLASSYATALTDGKAQWIERATATGSVRKLLRRVKRRSTTTLLESRTVCKGSRRLLRLDDSRSLPLNGFERERVFTAFEQHFKTHAGGRLTLLDIARRIAGVASLGLSRYVMLVREKDGPRSYILLDAKEARPSSLSAFALTHERAWDSDADRIVQVQHRMQAVSPARLQALTLGNLSLTVRQLQPTEDRLMLKTASHRPRHLRSAIRMLAETTAWAQLRSSGREGSATVDDLIALSRSRHWRTALVTYARRYQRISARDWRTFVTALDARVVELSPAWSRNESSND